MKRGADEISADRILEECVYMYIQRWQPRHNGKGVGIAVHDLNKNIVHPEKPTGKGSERQFTEMLRGMSSLTESDELWKKKSYSKSKNEVPEGLFSDQVVILLDRYCKTWSRTFKIG